MPIIIEIIIYWIIVPVLELAGEFLIAKPITKILRKNYYTNMLLFNQADGILATIFKSLLLLFAVFSPIVFTLIVIYS